MLKMKKMQLPLGICSVLIGLLGFSVSAGPPAGYVATTVAEKQFTLSAPEGVSTLVVSSADYPGVITALKNLQTDIGRVTDRLPDIVYNDLPGLHRLRFRVLDPGMVLQKILIDTGGLKPSDLGAPQSKQVKI